MNRTIKEAAVKRFHYESHEQLRTHLADFIAACNFGRRLKTLKGLTPYEYIAKIWTSDPDRFILNPIPPDPGTKHLALVAGALAMLSVPTRRPGLASPGTSSSVETASPQAATDAPARPEQCEAHHVAGTPPKVVNPRMQPRTTILCFQAYIVLFSGLTRTPLWSAERLTRDAAITGAEQERVDSFHEEPRLPAGDRSLLSDYVRSGYDRGHMTPSADMPSPAAQNESFSLANMVPQAPRLNRYSWADLERGVRRLAKDRSDVFVVTGPVYHGTQIVALQGRVYVPTSIYKAVYPPGVGAEAFVSSNSIADGSAAALRAEMVDHCVVIAKVGASTEWAIRMSPPGSFRTATISAGSNDVAIPGLRDRLERLRASVSAEWVMWILPYSPVAAQLVRQVAHEHGDCWISLADLPSRRDRVHPVSYRPLASALVATGFAGGREVLSPAGDAMSSMPVRVQAARHAVLLSR